VRDFHSLTVWKKAHNLTLDVYRETERFPKAEQFGLTSQIRRSAASVPANIAEGCGRTGDRELLRFIRIAIGSASELEYHLLLANDLHFLAPDSYERLCERTVEVRRMLIALGKKLLPRETFPIDFDAKLEEG
jgi:four helix bundle protein